MGYSPWGCKKSDMTEHACTHTFHTTQKLLASLTLPSHIHSHILLYIIKLSIHNALELLKIVLHH